MKRVNAWAGLVFIGVWLTSSAIADSGRGVRGGVAFRHSALIRDATISRQTAGLRRTALVRDATAFGSWGRGYGSRFGRYGYRSRYRYGYYRDRFNRYRDGYGDGAAYYNYAPPYDDAGPYGSGYFDPYLYPGDYNSYPYAPDYGGQTVAPEYGSEAPDAAPPVRTGAELVIAVQNKLGRQAYYDGPLDGVINEGTRRAIREYQKDHGMPVTGLISPDLLSSMAIRYVSPLT